MIRRVLKRRALPLLALVAVIPLAGCTTDQTWSAHDTSTTNPHLVSCTMAIGHQIDSVNTGVSKITYGTTVRCDLSGAGPGSAWPVHIMGYSQIADFPVIGFGSGKYGQATAAGSVDVIKGQSYSFHGTFTLAFDHGASFYWAPADGCTRTNPLTLNAGQVVYPDLRCSFSRTIRP